MNQGLRDCGAWVEHQLYDLKVMGMTLSGWSTPVSYTHLVGCQDRRGYEAGAGRQWVQCGSE